MSFQTRAWPLLRAGLHALDAETAHNLTLRAAAMGLAGMAGAPDVASLRVEAMGLSFPNPVGLAAGFDKNARVPDAMLRVGFGFVECGTVTPRPQAGNPRPRLFRLPEDRAVINRNGFNNEGLDALVARLEARAGRGGIVGANVGANKDAADRAADYATCVARVAGLAQYLTVNVSSPNTPGLRDLQAKGELDRLLAGVMEARAEAGAGAKPVLLKIAPDLAPEGVDDAVDVALARGVAGLIVSNTTIARPPTLRSANASETGGLSGAPLFALSTEALKRAARRADGRLVLVGAGGVDGPEAAYAKIRAGASLVQLYSALVYEGPGLVGRIRQGLAERLARDGFADVAAAVGVDL